MTDFSYMEAVIIDKLSQDENLAATDIILENQSHLHAGHAGAREGGHFHLTLTSPLFTGKSRIDRHRIVYEILQDEMKKGIHALNIKAFTPEEAAKKA